jgi:hypothetical protein
MLFRLPRTPSGSKWQICVLLREEVERQEIAQGQHHSRSCDVMRAEVFQEKTTKKPPGYLYKTFKI